MLAALGCLFAPIRMPICTLCGCFQFRTLVAYFKAVVKILFKWGNQRWNQSENVPQTGYLLGHITVPLSNSAHNQEEATSTSIIEINRLTNDVRPRTSQETEKQSSQKAE